MNDGFNQIQSEWSDAYCSTSETIGRELIFSKEEVQFGDVNYTAIEGGMGAVVEVELEVGSLVQGPPPSHPNIERNVVVRITDACLRSDRSGNDPTPESLVECPLGVKIENFQSASDYAYLEIPTDLTFTFGQDAANTTLTQSFTVSAYEDDEVETDEFLTLVLFGGGQYADMDRLQPGLSLGSNSRAVVNLSDSDMPPLPTAPTIADIEIESLPVAAAETLRFYVIGEEIRIAVHFDRPVEVTGTPLLQLDIAGIEIQTMQYAYGSGTSKLVFRYEVQEGPHDTKGIEVPEDGLLLNGGEIFARNISGKTPAILSHDAVFFGGDHSVDGLRPAFDSGSSLAFANEIVLGAIDVLDTAYTPPPGDFTVLVNDATVQVTSVEVAGKDVILSIPDNSVSANETVWISYTPSRNQLRDLYGNTMNAVSNLSAINTEGNTIPGAPTGLTAEPAGDGKIRLRWTMPSRNGGEPISDYEYMVDSDGWTPTDSTDTTYTVANLTNGTEYTFKVRAVNRNGESDASTSVMATPVEFVLEAPTNLMATAGDEVVELSWTAPADGGDPIVNYEYMLDNNGTWLPTGSTDTRYTVPNLTNGTEYTFQVRAVNSGGGGLASVPVMATPLGFILGAPTNLSATAGDEVVALNWTAPADGGDPIVDYEYMLDNNGTWLPTGSTSTNHTVANLTNGTAYTFQVRAVNSDGGGLASAPVMATPMEFVLEAPTNFRAMPRNMAVELNWTAPADGGDPIVGYEYMLDNNGSWLPTGSTATSYTVANLTNGTSYAFQVRAVNSDGGGLASVSATATPTEFSMGAPTNLRATAGDMAVTLDWTAPASGSPITDYEYMLDSSGAWLSTGSTATSYTVANLTNEVSYTLALRGVNAGGVGAPASTVGTPQEITVVVSFGSDSYRVAEGRTTMIEVRMSPADPLRPRVVSLAELPGTATPGIDYAALPSTVTFEPDETLKRVAFTAENDEEKGEEDETVILELSSQRETTIVEPPSSTTVTISEILLSPDAVNRELLPRIIQAGIASTLSAISDRAESADDPMGQSSIFQDALMALPSSMEQGSPSMRRLLAGKSFAMPLSAMPGDLSKAVLWGRGDYRDMRGGDDRPIKWDGNLTTVHVGADLRLRENLLAGLALSWSDGDFDYQDRTGIEKGRYESEMVSMHPYVSWSKPDNALRAWATVGYGRGEVDVENIQGRHSSDTRMKTGAAGVNMQVYAADGLLGASGPVTVQIKADGHVSEVKTDGGTGINPLTSDIQRLRVAVEGTHVHSLDGGGRLEPALEAGLRHDGGDGLEGTGVEIGASVRYVNPSKGVTAKGRGRYLVSHSDDYDEWGFSGEIRIDPGADGRGLAFSLEPSWGEFQSGLDRLWEEDVGDGALGNRINSAKGRLDVKVDYGLSAGDIALLTPYARISLLGGNRAYQLGNRIQIGSSFYLNTEGGLSVDALGETRHNISFRTEFQF